MYLDSSESGAEQNKRQVARSVVGWRERPGWWWRSGRCRSERPNQGHSQAEEYAQETGRVAPGPPEPGAVRPLAGDEPHRAHRRGHVRAHGDVRPASKRQVPVQLVHTLHDRAHSPLVS